MPFSALLSDAPEDFDSWLNGAGTDKVLTSMLAKLVEEKPEDHISFMITYLYTHKNAESSENDEDEMEIISEVVDEMPKAYCTKRRGAVSAEPNGETRGEVAEANPKGAETNERLDRALSRHILCSHLDDSEKKEVFDHMSEVSFSKGDFVITQGEDGDCFYVVDEGELEVYVNTDSERKLVQHISAGGSFGELALIYNTSRQADVVVRFYLFM